ncbi:hypothetical protein BCU68_03375 [Vibrio sp. 10N.286.49.B3]|nr:hypothetical protein BCU68_03375 [Vibrio sp. 10N.286.49.B3]
MFGGFIFWFVLSILIGVWASKLGRNGFVWGLIAAFISPLLAAICLLITGDKSEIFNIVTSDRATQVEKDKEWEVVKKYVPEVKSSLEIILDELTYKGIASAEKKLKELFFVIGKEGLTKEALSIIISDVKNEIEEQEKLLENNTINEAETLLNMDLIEKLKGNVKVGFNSSFSFCEICSSANTRQIVHEHYVCGDCKQRYL